MIPGSYNQVLDNAFINDIPKIEKAYEDAKKHIDEVCIKIIQAIPAAPKEASEEHQK